MTTVLHGHENGTEIPSERELSDRSRALVDAQRLHHLTLPDTAGKVIYLTGELSLCTAHHIARWVERIDIRRGSRLKLDLAEVSFIDLAGLAAICRVSRLAHQRQYLVTVNLSAGQVQRLFDIAGCDVAVEPPTHSEEAEPHALSR